MIALVRVFVSSTFIDLEAERTAVRDIILRMRELQFSGMEYFNAREKSADEVSLEEVERCQLYLGILGERHGTGITEQEYRHAQKLGLPCLMFLKRPDASQPAPEDLAQSESKERQRRLKAELSNPFSGPTPELFDGPEDLATKVAAALHSWLFDRYLAPELKKLSQRGEIASAATLLREVKDDAPLRKSLARLGVAAGSDVLDGLLQSAGEAIGLRLLEGVFALRTNHASSVQKFLALYLGSQAAPVPFGGRTDALNELDQWLDNDGVCCGLVAAEAGRGKSALLIHWSRRLLTRGDIAVVFMPISIRAGTNQANVFFPALAARLATLHGEPIPNIKDTGTEAWRGIASDLMSKLLPDGRKLVVIIDGLDEAADWEARIDLFPSASKGTRFLASARYTAECPNNEAWLRRLGWERTGVARVFPLPGLDVNGVADVLHASGIPLDVLGDRRDIVLKLHRLSEGDPLLVGLYVEKLQQAGHTAAGFSVADLDRLQPGLRGYFADWWEQQHRLWGKDASPLREPRAVAVLNLLACALGPLTSDELITLLPPEAKLDQTWPLQEVVRSLGRLVAGDGREDTGFVFSHPRFALHLREDLSAKERAQQEARFVAWGQEILDELEQQTLAADEAPPYLIRCLGAHMERSNTPIERRLRLLSPTWRRACELSSGGLPAFSVDVERIWTVAAQADLSAVDRAAKPPFLHVELLCALLHSSVRAITSNVPPRLIARLLRDGRWTANQALAYARQKSGIVERADALFRIALQLPVERQSAIREEALHGILSAPSAFQFDVEYLHAWIDLLPVEDIQRLIHRVPPVYVEDVLARLLCTVDLSKDLEKIRALIGLIPHSHQRSRTSAELIRRLIKENRYESVAAVVDSTPESERRDLFTELGRATLGTVHEPMLAALLQDAAAPTDLLDLLILAIIRERPAIVTLLPVVWGHRAAASTVQRALQEPNVEHLIELDNLPWYAISRATASELGLAIRRRAQPIAIRAMWPTVAQRIRGTPARAMLILALPDAEITAELLEQADTLSQFSADRGILLPLVPAFWDLSDYEISSLSLAETRGLGSAYVRKGKLDGVARLIRARPEFATLLRDWLPQMSSDDCAKLWRAFDEKGQRLGRRRSAVLDLLPTSLQRSYAIDTLARIRNLTRDPDFAALDAIADALPPADLDAALGAAQQTYADMTRDLCKSVWESHSGHAALTTESVRRLASTVSDDRAMALLVGAALAIPPADLEYARAFATFVEALMGDPRGAEIALGIAEMLRPETRALIQDSIWHHIVTTQNLRAASTALAAGHACPGTTLSAIAAWPFDSSSLNPNELTLLTLPFQTVDKRDSIIEALLDETFKSGAFAKLPLAVKQASPELAVRLFTRLTREELDKPATESKVEPGLRLDLALLLIGKLPVDMLEQMRAPLETIKDNGKRHKWIAAMLIHVSTEDARALAAETLRTSTAADLAKGIADIAEWRTLKLQSRLEQIFTDSQRQDLAHACLEDDESSILLAALVPSILGTSTPGQLYSICSGVFRVPLERDGFVGLLKLMFLAPALIALVGKAGLDECAGAINRASTVFP